MKVWPLTTFVATLFSPWTPPNASTPVQLGLEEKIPRQLLKKITLRGELVAHAEIVFPAATRRAQPGIDDHALAAADTSSTICELGAPSRFTSKKTVWPLSGSNQRIAGLNR